MEQAFFTRLLNTPEGIVAALLFIAIIAVIAFFRGEVQREREERKTTQEAYNNMSTRFLESANNMTRAIELLRTDLNAHRSETGGSR
jgi:hypothetical protein